MNETKISPRHAANDVMTTYADQLTREQYERAEKRRLDLAEQRSAANPPDVRIRVWERVHALRLPRDPEHPILYVIASGTGLTLTQVREEQRTRSGQHTALAGSQESSAPTAPATKPASTPAAAAR